MSHIDPEVIALVALGEPAASDGDRRHLATCDYCDSEVQALSAAVRVGREAQRVEPLLSPSPAVWSAISDELGLPTPFGAAQSLGARHTPLRRRRRLRLGRTLSVLAGVAAVALAAVLVWRGTLPPTSRVLATAQLAAFPSWPDASGRAVAQALPDGARELHVELSAPSTPDSFHEVWLISSDATRLVSLGVLDGHSGSFAIPRDIDIADFDLVDVSAEPLDGNTAHSGDSIVRGPLA